ncbi:MAG: hypothetical protein EXS05_04740 [Planctomycetaceae bacterium]|nr:hypothetical protein [Planctomycetaceae bacterium]
MTIVLPALAMSAAAFAIWLTVRIINRRERWTKWTAVLVVVAILGYPLSVGPACWFSSQTGIGARAVTVLYVPLLSAIDELTFPTIAWEPAWRIANDYMGLFATADWGWRVRPGWNEQGEYCGETTWEYSPSPH